MTQCKDYFRMTQTWIRASPHFVDDGIVPSVLYSVGWKGDGRPLFKHGRGEHRFTSDGSERIYTQNIILMVGKINEP